MKHLYILLAILLTCATNLFAQTITITGACGAPPNVGVNGDYSLSENINDRPSYVRGVWVISWSGTKWNVINTDANPQSVGITNLADTPTPPATSLFPWTPVPPNCFVAGTFSGDGTTTTLNTQEVQFGNTKIKLFPNPATNSIIITGVNKEVSYKVYNILGKVVLKGSIFNNQGIEIKELPSGLYYLKLNDEKTLKLIKK